MPNSSSTSPSARAKKIFEHVEHSGLTQESPDAILFANGAEPHLDASFFYVSRFPYGLFEGSYLLARPDGSVSVFTGILEAPIAEANRNGMEVHVGRDEKGVVEKLRETLRGGDHETIGVNAAELTFEKFNVMKSLFKSAQIIDVGNAVAEARAIKDDAEVASIKKACDIASRVYGKVPNMLKEGVTESEIAAGLAYEMQKAGGSGVSFDSIVAFGKNSAFPHYSPGRVKLRKSQLVLLDYGTRFRRYCSDITRTLVHGKATKEQKRMYGIVREALKLGTELCTPTLTGREVHEKVATFIDSTEYRGKFIHGTGHSLGLSVHDGEGLSMRSKDNLKPGMVLTVEPGIYVRGFGGVRIEDDVLITKDKPRVLTSAKRELIEI